MDEQDTTQQAKGHEPLSDDELSENEEIDLVEGFDGVEYDIDDYNNKFKFFIKKGDNKKEVQKIFRFITPRFLQVYRKDPKKGKDIFTANRMNIRIDNTETKNLVRIKVKDMTAPENPDDLMIKFDSVVKNAAKPKGNK